MFDKRLLVYENYHNKIFRKLAVKHILEVCAISSCPLDEKRLRISSSKNVFS